MLSFAESVSIHMAWPRNYGSKLKQVIPYNRICVYVTNKLGMKPSEREMVIKFYWKKKIARKEIKKMKKEKKTTGIYVFLVSILT